MIKLKFVKRYDKLDNIFVINDHFNGVNFDAKDLKLKLISLRNNLSISNRQECKNCYNYLPQTKHNKEPLIKFLELNHWKCCFLNCSYCKDKKTDDISTVMHYDITPIIDDMLTNNVISQNTKIIISCGDALLHPEFDKLMYFFINSGMKDIDIFTSAQRYCHSISEAIDKKIARIFISFDGGCPYIYEKVKGYNKFDIAVKNLKRYILYDYKSKGRVILTYKLVKGVNDNKKEILDWFMMARGFHIKKTFVDIDEFWYDELNGFPDDNLKDLLLFIRELSDLNCYDIEFSLKLKYMFNHIKKDGNVCI